jgi:general secretion pathway protein G
MGPPYHHRAFTLIEVLIVVVIMAVLAAVVIPQFTSSTQDAKQASLKHNLHTFQSQIELYRQDHLGNYPTLANAGLPQLMQSTNARGEAGPLGPAYPLGPYFIEVPTNPYDGSTRVTAVATSGKTPAGVVGSPGGWQYDESTGAVWPNNPEYYR